MSRELDQVKAAAFLDSNAAFLGSILCNIQFSWSSEIDTAGINNKELVWNKDWFDSLTKDERIGVLLHELWHYARLHVVRQGSREKDRWNVACDLRINFDLKKDGYTLPAGALYDRKYTPEWSEEAIYNDLPEILPIPTWGAVVGDMIQGDQNIGKQELVNVVQNAIQQTKILGGDIPGKISKIVSEFLKPKLPWWRLLRNYLTEQMETSWSWSRPNKRFSEVYLPHLSKDEGRLERIALFLDTSGSIEDQEVKQFNSEAKYIQEVLNPEKLTVIMFDTEIQKVLEFTEDKPYKDIVVVGRGGTSLEPVHDYIVKHKPSCSIIFSDLYCSPMNRVKTPVIWVISGDHTAPSWGKSFRI